MADGNVALPSAVPLIYVASIGRSGSTLLESMLGAHSAVATTGELHIWPHEARQTSRDCACGLPVDRCPLWARVRADADPLTQPVPRLDHFREHHNGGRTLRPRRALDLWTGRSVDNATVDAIARYAENTVVTLAAYRAAFADLTGRSVDWLVDASKDPYRLDWLARSGRFDLRVVHMVKDPRAFAYSVTRDQIGTGPVGARLRKTARQSGAWVTQNLLFERLGRTTLADRYLRMPYERFAADPAASYAEVCAFIGVPFEAGAVERFREGSIHTIAGNPMRYETRPIALDERWREALPPSSRVVVDTVTMPFRRRVGY